MITSTNELVWLSHSGLDVYRPEIVPSLLQERYQEVKSHKDILSDFFFRHLLVSDGDGHAGNFLKLELNGSSSVVNLLSETFVVGDDLREHTDSVKDGS